MNISNNQDFGNFLTKYSSFEPYAIYRHLTMLSYPIKYFEDTEGKTLMQGADGKQVWIVQRMEGIVELYYMFITADDVNKIFILSPAYNTIDIQSLLAANRDNIRFSIYNYSIDYSSNGYITKINFYDPVEQDHTEMLFYKTPDKQGYLLSTIIKGLDDRLLESTEYYCCLLPEKYFFFGKYPKFEQMMDVIEKVNDKKFHINPQDRTIYSYDSILQRLLDIVPKYMLLSEHKIIFARTSPLLNSFLSTFYEGSLEYCYAKLTYDKLGNITGLYFGPEGKALVFNDREKITEINATIINKNILIQRVIFNYINYHVRLFTNELLTLKVEDIRAVKISINSQGLFTFYFNKGDYTLMCVDHKLVCMKSDITYGMIMDDRYYVNRQHITLAQEDILEKDPVVISMTNDEINTHGLDMRTQLA